MNIASWAGVAVQLMITGERDLDRDRGDLIICRLCCERDIDHSRCMIVWVGDLDLREWS